MPDDLTRLSDRILSDSRAVLRDNQTGGRHRLEGRSIGQGSAKLKRKHFTRKLIQLAVGMIGIFVAAGVAGAILNGIGFWGVMISLLVMFLLFGVVFKQKIKVPQRADLTRTQDARQLVARTELWLEHQRHALPAPAVKIVDDLGVQLDALGKQLAHVDPTHEAAGEVRRLVGEILPETIDSYTKIPANLRNEERAGSTPDKQLVSSLGKISKEVDSVTRQLAQGSLDDLAIKDRYLDYRYGDAEGMALGDSAKPTDSGTPLSDEGSGVPLPDFDRAKSKS
ncbi:hypothetical protein [Erythrobacter alti]|uniref:hypothetical protein n=1 Tax=Erythrobacter alti TaxID=1896145 RepID=UPI0030F3DF8B